MIEDRVEDASTLNFQEQSKEEDTDNSKHTRGGSDRWTAMQGFCDARQFYRGLMAIFLGRFILIIV